LGTTFLPLELNFVDKPSKEPLLHSRQNIRLKANYASSMLIKRNVLFIYFQPKRGLTSFPRSCSELDFQSSVDDTISALKTVYEKVKKHTYNLNSLERKFSKFSLQFQSHRMLMKK